MLSLWLPRSCHSKSILPPKPTHISTRRCYVKKRSMMQNLLEDMSNMPKKMKSGSSRKHSEAELRLMSQLHEVVREMKAAEQKPVPKREEAQELEEYGYEEPQERVYDAKKSQWKPLVTIDFDQPHLLRRANSSISYSDTFFLLPTKWCVCSSHMQLTQQRLT